MHVMLLLSQLQTTSLCSSRHTPARRQRTLWSSCCSGKLSATGCSQSCTRTTHSMAKLLPMTTTANCLLMAADSKHPVLEDSGRLCQCVQHAKHLLHLGAGVHHSGPVGQGWTGHSWGQSKATSASGRFATSPVSRSGLHCSVAGCCLVMSC